MRLRRNIVIVTLSMLQGFIDIYSTLYHAMGGCEASCLHMSRSYAEPAAEVREETNFHAAAPARTALNSGVTLYVILHTSLFIFQTFYSRFPICFWPQMASVLSRPCMEWLLGR
jgi:hypothetical protein